MHHASRPFIFKLFTSAIIFSSITAVGYETRIINGAPVAPGEYGEVVKITAGNAACSATIVGPRVLVTAAHCAATGDTVKFTVGKTEHVATVTRSPLYPTQDHDVAVAVSDREIDVLPATIGGDAAKGVELTLVGFGCIQPGGGGGNDGIKRRGTTVVTGTSNLDLVSKKEGGAALCWGDSGGPAYVGNNLVGIGSKGDIIRTNYHARLDTKESHEFLADVAKCQSVEICGINADCRTN